MVRLDRRSGSLTDRVLFSKNVVGRIYLQKSAESLRFCIDSENIVGFNEGGENFVK